MSNLEDKEMSKEESENQWFSLEKKVEKYSLELTTKIHLVMLVKTILVPG